MDVLVNVAGILRRGSILEASDEAWQMTFDAHVNGTRNTMRSVGARWRDTPGRHRRVINISSDSGLYGDADYAAYAAAKAAVIGLTLSAAVTLAEVGATANVFIPQALTRMTRSIPADELPDNDRARWDSGEFAAANVPPVLLFVASDEADWMSGRIVGGWGFEAHQYSQAARARSIYSPGPWDLDTLFVGPARLRGIEGCWHRSGSLCHEDAAGFEVGGVGEAVGAAPEHLEQVVGAFDSAVGGPVAVVPGEDLV